MEGSRWLSRSLGWAGLWALPALMALPVVAAEVELTRPVLALERSAPGRFDLDLHVAHVTFRAAASADAQAFRIAAGQFTWSDPGADVGARSARGSFAATGRFAPGFEAALELELAAGDLAIGPLRVRGPAQLSAKLRDGGDGLALEETRLRAAGLALDRVEVSAVDARLAYARQTLRIEALRHLWCGGRWTGAGRVSFDRAAFDLTVGAEEVALAALVEALGGDPQQGLGRLGGEGRFRGDLPGTEGWLERLRGSGRFAIQGGTLPSFALLAATWNAVVGRVPGLGARGFEHRGATPTRLVALTQSFELRSGRVFAEDARLETDDYAVWGSGSLGLDTSLDYDMRFRLTEAGLKKLLSMARIPMPLGSAPELVTVPVRVGGRLEAPVYQVDVSKVPARTLTQLLSGAPRGLLSGVTGVVREGTGVVRKGLGRVLDAPGKSEAAEP